MSLRLPRVYKGRGLRDPLGLMDIHRKAPASAETMP